MIQLAMLIGLLIGSLIVCLAYIRRLRKKYNKLKKELVDNVESFFMWDRCGAKFFRTHEFMLEVESKGEHGFLYNKCWDQTAPRDGQ